MSLWSRILHSLTRAWHFVVLCLHALDRWLVWFSQLFGVNLPDPHKRFGVFLGIYAVIYIVGFLPIAWLPLFALTIGYIGILAIGRAWVVNEKERTLIAKKLKDGNPDEMPDLRWTAVASAVQLLILFPLIFQQAQRHFGLYTVPEGMNFSDWVIFTLDSYNKAFLNLLEVYGVRVHHVSYQSAWGRHVVTLCRLTFDYLLIQGVFRLLSIRETVQDAVRAVNRDPEMAIRLGRRATEPLIAYLQDSPIEGRCGAAEALGRLHDARAVMPLIAILQGTDGPICRVAATALGELNDARAVEPLIAVFTTRDAMVRADAARALSKFKDPRSVEPLIAALQDTNEFLRCRAAEGLGELKDTRAVKPLIAALQDKEEVRVNAAAALGKLNDPRAVDPLIALFRDASVSVRCNAAEALSKLNDLRAIEPLIATLNDADDVVRWTAAEALGELKDGRAVDPLISALHDTHGDVRWKAAWALGELSVPRAIEALISASQDKYPLVRQAVVEALGKLKDPRVVEPLLLLLNDVDGNVREATALVVKSLDPMAATKAGIK